MLTRRDHTRQELTHKLAAKGHTPEPIEAILTELAQGGYLNESRFVENYIYFRRRRGIGPKRIAEELAKRGVRDEMIAEHVQIADNAWFVEARNVWLKHFKGEKPADFKAKAKQMRFLHYRGFTQEHIDTLFDN